MSRAVPIGGKKKENKAPQVPQSLPANFYRGYVPPKTPKINPVPEPPPMEALIELPPASQESVGLNLQTGSFSMNNNKHPMSLPVNSGFMGGLGAMQLKNRVNISSNNNNSNSNNSNSNSNNNNNSNNNDKNAMRQPQYGAISEIKEDETNELANGVKNMQVGSLTAFAMMGGDTQSMSSFADQDSVASDNVNSIINENTNMNNNNNSNTTDENQDKQMDSAQNQNDPNQNETQFDMEEEEEDQFDME